MRTPLDPLGDAAFVLGYTTWFRLSWPARLALSVIAFAIVYAFMVILNVDLHEGFVVTLF